MNITSVVVKLSESQCIFLGTAPAIMKEKPRSLLMNYANVSLAELATSIPMASEIFRKNRLDFCCGGKQTLKEACEKKQLNVESIVEQLKTLEAKPNTTISEMPLEELTGYIVKRYHDDLRKRIPELVRLSEKVEKVHADHPLCPTGLTQLMTTIQDEMLMHLMKEENVLFPMIEAHRGAMAFMPVKVMTLEHDAHGENLEAVHRLTHNFTAPEDACATWRTLYKGLEKLEEELMEHIHIENHILFPRALAQKA